MNERVRMYHFDSGGNGVDPVHICVDQFARSIGKQWSDALATAQRRITHG
jgi:hypothetical protein